MGMGLGRVAQMRDRIAGERIGAGLRRMNSGWPARTNVSTFFPGNKIPCRRLRAGNGILSLVPRATPLPVSVAAPVPV